MTFTSPYKQHNFMGRFETDSEALTFIQAQEWDSNGDGTGDPQPDQCYWNTHFNEMRSWNQFFGMWLPERASQDGDDYGDGSDGDVIISSGTTTLTRDMMYNNLTIDGTGVVDTAGYKIFVKERLRLADSGIIRSNGGNGGNGADAVTTTGGAGGAAGTAVPSGSTGAKLAGVVGGDGKDSEAPSSGSTGTNGLTATQARSATVGANGGAGGSGTGGNGGLAGGTGGTPTAKPAADGSWNRRNVNISWWGETDSTRPSGVAGGGAASGGGGGGGNGTNSGAGGGGGGSGASGGHIVIAARIIEAPLSSPWVEALGGNGGDGGNGSPDGDTPGTDDGGPGGGGGGGTGGVVVISHAHHVDGLTLAEIDISGGTGGIGPGNAADGEAGPDGQVLVFGPAFDPAPFTYAGNFGTKLFDWWRMDLGVTLDGNLNIQTVAGQSQGIILGNPDFGAGAHPQLIANSANLNNQPTNDEVP